jgi:hypothetical protein
VTWKTASNEAVKFDPRSRIRNLMPSNRSSRLRARLRACCRVHLAGRVRGDAGEVHPASAVLDGHQDTYSLLSSTVSTCRKSTARLPAA